MATLDISWVTTCGISQNYPGYQGFFQYSFATFVIFCEQKGGKLVEKWPFQLTIDRQGRVGGYGFNMNIG